MRPVPDHPASSDGSAHNPSTGTVRSAGSTPLAIDLSLVDLERDARRIIGEMAYAYFSGRGGGRATPGRERGGVEPLAAPPPGAGRDRPDHHLDHAPGRTGPLAGGDRPHGHPGLGPSRGREGHGPWCGRGGRARWSCSSLATCSLEDVAAAAPGAPRWMQIYILRVTALHPRPGPADGGARIRRPGLTVDAPVSGLRLRELRSGVHLPPDLSLPNLTGDSTARAHEGGLDGRGDPGVSSRP